MRKQYFLCVDQTDSFCRFVPDEIDPTRMVEEEGGSGGEEDSEDDVDYRILSKDLRAPVG
jgi:hypothetical protein